MFDGDANACAVLNETLSHGKHLRRDSLHGRRSVVAEWRSPHGRGAGAISIEARPRARVVSFLPPRSGAPAVIARAYEIMDAAPLALSPKF